MGVWIETEVDSQHCKQVRVTPCMGVWIETALFSSADNEVVSHPVWVCGLKLVDKDTITQRWCHTLYGCVD